ncbi:hypothetical protein A2697_01385 [Candidatus Curtissbacteria bacterium RIFCSPHIGHO2_01_FULL_41_44]|uniref:Uncharacterized protein n=1 Tax=Candidatus Curtissbacteria bacterium RIFCSPLOWO2_01_FULL_42_50 TaxID=1797730 RepID=A0A1F5H3G8_9BACT|nr:MAG: hypothetical protein A3C33_00600 [Candidatus Curtissbacteria bacterium RIFCSPHIGHO2_02_FULL_42_58]OGD94562.1 MAG: hypothetical protein A2697_01385 [Candidatus Curtissbacteria bacterium RIFCSPHIGHO2_01_FULL_41_44]OGD97945.1 MAG: hypothetical protein A3E71_03860 [Candidatus Curtissbacteria bacterium RIFCSPHIGHO2_12_FULL_42_33]OGD98595.1 MAG: hypothetical protein A3B54_05430 [Candidatus Curtissbacteria bacterium RIFCSPLOWO2_01_FULL_42_50]OGE11198.1 MAG: hypothetical protein A3H87_01505 [Ca
MLKPSSIALKLPSRLSQAIETIGRSSARTLETPKMARSKNTATKIPAIPTFLILSHLLSIIVFIF